jgi:hypothetical protein
LFEQMESDSKFQYYLRESIKVESKYSVEAKYDMTLSPEKLGIKLSFWDQNMDRYPAPYISQVRVADGMVYYYSANPSDQSLQLVTSEPLSALLESHMESH